MRREADPRDLASLTWKQYQRGTWMAVSIVLPASSAARVGLAILRTFSASPSASGWTPRDLWLDERVRRFAYRGDECVLLLRRLGPHSRGVDE